MKMITGLLRPTSGGIFFQGHKWSREDLSQIGALIETPPIYENLTAWENLKVRALLLDVDEKRMQEVLCLVDLVNTGKKKAGAFSMGMKQRLGIALALLNHPRLLVLDEPINGLDPLGIQELRGLIRSFPREGITVILSSHILSEIQQTADYIGMLSGGRLIFQDTLSMLRARSQRRLILRTSDQEGAANIFRQQAGILAQVCPGGLICPELPDGTLASLLRRLVEHGIDLYRVEEEKQSLEDLYLGMVKEAGL